MSTDTASTNQRSDVTHIIRIKDSKNLYKQQRLPLSFEEAFFKLLPSRWFELHILGDDHFEAGQGHAMLERVAGPPVGSFHIWHREGHIHVRALPELDEDGGKPPWGGCFDDVEEAVQAIANALDVKLRAWALPPPGAIAAVHGDRPG